MMLLLFGGQSLYSLSGEIADGRNGSIGVFGGVKAIILTIAWKLRELSS
ncbi:hypothetical protein [Sphingobacterium sp. BIGb0116]|nr:hypothetical protein [Sphingobacterium sp. BIGb0116]MCS4166181.1 hypothetical protein [Sphingobacterium sp. BIGb0116]